MQGIDRLLNFVAGGATGLGLCEFYPTKSGCGNWIQSFSRPRVYQLGRCGEFMMCCQLGLGVGGDALHWGLHSGGTRLV
jgi:hypothetical protein